MAKYIFNPAAAKPRTATAITTIRRSKSKSIDAAIVSAAILHLHRKGKSYEFVRANLVHSGHTPAEAVALCDACFYTPPPAP